MASLNKLAIRGIRSFDDKHVQVIEFYSPLTVIVGHNGSGKTTIIECLKYATTGDLPPNTKGGAFVHDPKMANEKEVKAQVRLRFWNVNRQRMTVTRSLQVSTKKNGALSMKTLEGLLAKTDEGGGDGKRNTISTKCSELDEEVPLLLGVSKAILENVIFCHQEDSNWPLSEPAALKKKFDDIFEATKYTKALDNIKTLRKERVAELKVDNERLKFLKADKDKAERLRRELSEMVRKEETKQTEAEQLKEETHRLKEINTQYYQQATSFNVIFENFNGLKERKKMLEKNAERMSDGMTALKEPTEELQHMFQNFDQHLKAIAAKRDQQQALKEKEDAALDDLRRRESNLRENQGELRNNRKNYERNVRERESTVRDLANTHNYPGYDYSPLEETKIVDFLDKLHELVRKAESDLKKVQHDGNRKERQMQAELDQLSSAKTTAIATKQSKQDQITQINTRIRRMETKFDSFSSVDADISVLENDVSTTEMRRDSLEQEIQQARYDEQIRERTATIRQKEVERDKLNGELSALNMQADSRAQLSIKRSELESKNAQVNASVSSHKTRFGELIGSELTPETMEEAVTSAMSKKERELQDAESTAAANERELSQLQTSNNIAKRNLQSKKTELEEHEAVITDALADSGKDTVDVAIEEAETEIDLIKEDLAEPESKALFYRRILENGKRQHKCIGCNRGIQQDERALFEDFVKSCIAKLSSTANRDAVKQDLQEWQAQLDKLRRAQHSAAAAKNLKETGIPAIQAQIAEEAGKLADVNQQVELSRAAVQKAKLATRDLQALKSAAAIMTRTVGELKDLRTDIKRLERDLKSSGSLKTVDEVQHEVDVISNAIKNLQREQSSLSSEKELKLNNMRTLGDELNRKTLKLGDLRGKQQQRKMDEASLKEQQELVSSLQRELKELDVAAAAAVAPWREMNDSLDRYRIERQNAEDEASTQVGIYQSSLGELEARHKACQTYVTEGNDRKLRENESLLEGLRGEIGRTKEARQKIEMAISGLRDDINRAEVTRKNIKNNLDWRQETESIKQLQEEMDEIDMEQAMIQRKHFNEEYRVKLDEENSTNSKWQLASGQLMQMTEERKRLDKTLKADYKNIESDFRNQLIKTKTAEVANNDLEKYGKALDNAILRYHAIKMGEINDTIGHLWGKTYQGTDIDGIRIVSDHDEQSTTARKSYNYRVVMIKNQVELDMRGRCSAGQKVLASIIIRLALAESFGQGCGVLALDEPTTNLDQENINALAEALAEIIHERRRQANFQLIVITHDEGFLQRLAQQDVVEYYWRVSRDTAQKSVLERQRVGI